ncbi:hypothetical protein WA026_014229 [Henosepilachna vigintioctopunctata]|uniref:Uncharacterized protein n=1 Tax=Henosepilachna vigintioctopunctata TaxID=420089 RepID=A0AAW1TM08_9CUCU
MQWCLKYTTRVVTRKFGTRVAKDNFEGSIIYRNVSQESTNSGPNDGSLMINQVEEEYVADYTVVSSDKLLRMTSTIMYQIVDLNKKFDDLEMRSNPQKWKFFQQNLPCRSLADVEKVDRYLEDMNTSLSL